MSDQKADYFSGLVIEQAHCGSDKAILNKHFTFKEPAKFPDAPDNFEHYIFKKKCSETFALLLICIIYSL